MAIYSVRMDPGKTEEAEPMQVHCNPANVSALRTFARPQRCSLCGDRMVAPFMTEFVEGGEIRHHWLCEDCGESSTTTITLAPC
jgi:hypothetical protein